MDWHGYEQTRTFELPGLADGYPVFDDLPSGALIASDGESIFVETAPKSNAFEVHMANLSGYCAFIRANEQGLVAWCDSVKLIVFELNAPEKARQIDLAGYDAEWLDEFQLAVTVPGGVTLVDTASMIAASLVTNIGGASGGVTFDDQGAMLTGNGSDGSPQPSVTGTVKRYAQSEIATAIASRVPIDFEQSGQAVVELLSSAYLGFDRSGNLHISGMDPQGTDTGFAALISAKALQAAISGGGIVDEQSPPEDVHRFDPDSAPGNFYFVNSNKMTGELYFSDFNAMKVFVFER